MGQTICITCHRCIKMQIKYNSMLNPKFALGKPYGMLHNPTACLVSWCAQLDTWVFIKEEKPNQMDFPLTFLVWFLTSCVTITSKKNLIGFQLKKRTMMGGGLGKRMLHLFVGVVKGINWRNLEFLLDDLSWALFISFFLIAWKLPKTKKKKKNLVYQQFCFFSVVLKCYAARTTCDFLGQ